MTLGIELRFVADAESDLWLRTIDVLLAWRPALAPRDLKRKSDIGAPRREPWNDALRPELARRLAEESGLLWEVICAHGSILVHREPRLVAISALIKEDPTRGADELADLLGALDGVLVPRLAMTFDADDERERSLDINRLEDLPRVLYLGQDAIGGLGGSARLRAAPAAMREIAGGLLFEILPTQLDAMRSFLAISVETPLALSE